MPATRTRYPQYINPAKLTSAQRSFSSTPSIFGADNRTCSERSERNSISEQVYLQSIAPTAQRAGANQRSAVCRQNVVLFQVRCRMKKRQPFRIVFFGADNRTCSERSERNSISEQVYLQSVAPAAQRAGAHGVCRQCTALSQVLLQTKDMKKRTEIIRFVFVSFGADNRTCSERSERNSISEQVYLQSVAPAAQRAGANKRSVVCRQNVVLFQVRCRMKKDNPFGLSFFGADNRT